MKNNEKLYYNAPERSCGCKFYKTAEQLKADKMRAAQGLYGRTGLNAHEYMERSG